MRPTLCIICLSAVFLVCGPFAYESLAQEAAPVALASVQLPEDINAVAVVDQVDSGMTGWTAVSSDDLDQMRGGFDLGNGLEASFGIERAVYVNGNLVTSTSFNIPDISHITTAQATAMQDALGTLSLTQIGPNNTFDPPKVPGQTTAATVIQNSLSNQNIQSITTINASVNSLNVFRQANFQNALQQAQLQSIGH